MWFIQVELRKISYIGTLFRVQDSGLFMVRFRQVSPYFGLVNFFC